MKRIFTLFSLCAISIASFAQLQGSGYYRAMNTNTERFIYVIDDKGSINVSANEADTEALKLRKGAEYTLDDPASVLYGLSVGDDMWDLQAQGSGVYGIIGLYVKVTSATGNGNPYFVSGTTSGTTVYLVDKETNTSLEYGKLATGGSTLKRWTITPMSQETNYLGVTPYLSAGSKYYSAYYASFPFSFYSEGMKAYYVSKVDYEKNVAVIKEVTGIVPKSTPVIIECSTQKAATNKLALEDYQENSAKPQDNLLSGQYFSHHDHFYDDKPSGRVEYDPNTMRVLSVVDGKLAYVNAKDNKTLLNYQPQTAVEDEYWGGVTYEPRYLLKANQSYLTVSAGSADTFQVMTEAEYEAAFPSTPAGDVTGDGSLDTQDCILVLNFYTSGSGSIDTKVADVTGDGVVDVQDITMLLNLYLSSK